MAPGFVLQSRRAIPFVMRVSRLELFDFRNYSQLRLEPGLRLNVLVGPNAQGKSNLLEALYVLATTKSLRAGRDGEMVRFGADAGRIVADVARDRAGDVQLELAIGAPGATNIVERKIVKINHGRHARIADLIGNLNAVLFSSVDLDIVRGEPEERRRFLNYEIAQVSPRYVVALAAYKRALEQRNRLLKDVRWGHADTASLEAWSQNIVEHGSKLIERRRAYVDKLSVHAADVHGKLTGGRETLVIEYGPSFALSEAVVTADEVADVFARALAGVRRDEIQRGTTLLGPQRDDLCFRVGADKESAIDVKTFGSQGQQRTVALALRLAERRLIEEMIGEPPVVLLDDVLSDLDESRRAQIFALALGGGQTFLTTTDINALPREAVDNAAVWKVEAGTVAAA